jgi:hypothetical protein
MTQLLSADVFLLHYQVFGKESMLQCDPKHLQLLFGWLHRHLHFHRLLRLCNCRPLHLGETHGETLFRSCNKSCAQRYPRRDCSITMGPIPPAAQPRENLKFQIRSLSQETQILLPTGGNTRRQTVHPLKWQSGTSSPVPTTQTTALPV